MKMLMVDAMGELGCLGRRIILGAKYQSRIH